jgi:membrane protease YdiL (CAAX protease family)
MTGYLTTPNRTADHLTGVGTKPVVVADYHHSLWRPGIGRWRGAVAIVLMLVSYLTMSTVLSLGAMMVDIALGNSTMADLRGGTTLVTPLMLLAVNLTAVTLIPISLLLQRWLFGVRAGFMSSTCGMFRWRLLGKVTAVVVPLWLVYVGISMIVGIPGQPTSYALKISVPLLLVVLLTTWAQSAGEEYGFRGLITRSIGSWFANSRTALVVATLVANVLFMIAHFAGDPWLITYYFIFGVSLSIISWRTGGLESGVLIHAVNNVLLMIPVALFMGGQLDMNRSAGVGGPFMLLPMGMMVLVAVLLSWYAHRKQLAAVDSSL